MSGKKGTKHSSKEFKLEAVRMFFEEGMTRAKIGEALSLPSAGRVKAWVRQYHGSYQDGNYGALRGC